MSTTPTSSLAAPTASIHSLAVETVLHILELTVEPFDIRADLSHCPDPTDRFPTLMACALVCRDWRAPACALLWRHVSLKRHSQYVAWVRSPAFGKFPTTQSLHLTGDDIGSNGNELTGMHLQMAVERGMLEGLQALHLTYFRHGECGIPANLWAMDGLSSLRHLKLGHNCPIDPYFAGTSVMRPSFELLTFASEQQEPWLFQILFGASSATLTSLRAEYVIDTRLSGQLHRLESLESLSIQYIRDPDDIYPSFATLTSLRRFALEGRLDQSDEQRDLLFKSIKAPLEELVFKGPTPEWRTALDRALAEGVVSVATLQRVELWNESEFSPDWVTDLEASGIEVVVMKSDSEGGSEVRRSKPKAR